MVNDESRETFGYLKKDNLINHSILYFEGCGVFNMCSKLIILLKVAIGMKVIFNS